MNKNTVPTARLCPYPIERNRCTRIKSSELKPNIFKLIHTQFSVILLLNTKWSKKMKLCEPSQQLQHAIQMFIVFLDFNHDLNKIASAYNKTFFLFDRWPLIRSHFVSHERFLTDTNWNERIEKKNHNNRWSNGKFNVYVYDFWTLS